MTPALRKQAEPDYAEIERLALAATPGPWDTYGERINGSRSRSATEALLQVNQTDDVSDHFWLLNAEGKCPALTGCGPTSKANAAFIAAANPSAILYLLAEIRASKAREEKMREAAQHLDALIERAESIRDTSLVLIAARSYIYSIKDAEE